MELTHLLAAHLLTNCAWGVPHVPPATEYSCCYLGVLPCPCPLMPRSSPPPTPTTTTGHLHIYSQVQPENTAPRRYLPCSYWRCLQ